MRVAVTYENGLVFQHFGHAERFKIYDIDDGRVQAATTVNTNGSGHGSLAAILKNLNVDTLICGGIGGGAKTALSDANIRLLGGVSGDADKAVEAFLAGALAYNSEITCNHHGEHHGGHSQAHTCSEHGCGGEHHHHHGAH
ncbi:NifB/NifX family molybdenum-iron cluster-binding protein [Oscillospiraceae bacterium CM]|nr:NifB/NifX family molybdenum-iron cluster-binding protein [Oscillospiraceae bacterium CM]